MYLRSLGLLFFFLFVKMNGSGRLNKNKFHHLFCEMPFIALEDRTSCPTGELRELSKVPQSNRKRHPLLPETPEGNCPCVQTGCTWPQLPRSGPSSQKGPSTALFPVGLLSPLGPFNKAFQAPGTRQTRG